MAKTKNSDRKTRAGSTGAVKNPVILTPDELKALIDLVKCVQDSFCGGDAPDDRRYRAKLEKIKGKLRRGF